MGFSEKEIGRMTARKFMRLYQHYKNNFDVQLVMRSKGLTYAKLEQMQMEEEEWLP